MDDFLQHPGTLAHVLSQDSNPLIILESAGSLMKLPPILSPIGLTVAFALSGVAQTFPDLEAFFQQSTRLTPDEIAKIQAGHAVSKVPKPRTPAEILVFGAVRINASPEAYIQFANDFDRLRRLPEFLAIGEIGDPPKIRDFTGFDLDATDISALKACRPQRCDLQLQAEAMTAIQSSVNWSAPDVADQVNRRLQGWTFNRLLAYRRDGNRALGIYNDEERPTDVAQHFENLLSYSEHLPRYLPELYRYLLAYPAARPPNAKEKFYWAKVKFGLKPTLRIVQRITLAGRDASQPAYAIVEKQLYASHYFNAALDLTFCVRSSGGFYLIRAVGSEQAGLTGFTGSILRRVAVSRTASSLKDSLNAVKVTLETETARH